MEDEEEERGIPALLAFPLHQTGAGGSKEVGERRKGRGREVGRKREVDRERKAARGEQSGPYVVLKSAMREGPDPCHR